MKLLDNKVALITGAARGIGEGIALKFAAEGAHVAFTYVSDSSAALALALEEKLKAMGVNAKAYQSNAGYRGASSLWHHRYTGEQCRH
jgi:3-oxoacyl-[acyl-carrier protein] reductase